MAAYGDNTDFRVWAESLGLCLDGSEVRVEALRTQGSLYLDSAYEYKLQCSERSGGWTQELAWPRKGHRDANGREVPDDLIPPQWITASYRAAYLISVNPAWASNSRDVSRITKREKVDTIEREFFKDGEAGSSLAAAGMASDGMIEGLIKPLMCTDYKRGINQLFRVI